jgi:hypothetical protein
MRFLVIALAAALLALPAVTPASACGAHTAKAATANYSAKKKTTKKMAKKTVKKKRKAKVEYMRIAPYK